MKIFLLAILTLCFSATSCQVAENTVVSQESQKEIVTKKFEKDGVSFLYPDSWKIRYDEVYRELGRVIAVEDSKDSIFIVSLFPLEVPLNLQEYAEEVKKELKAKVKNGSHLEIKTSEVNRNILLEQSKGIRLKFSLENVPHI